MSSREGFGPLPFEKTWYPEEWVRLKEWVF